jgi:hypothetical protein
MPRLALAGLVACCVPALGVAQTAHVAPSRDAIRRAAATITESDVRRRIFLIAHDSMGGRDTPSPGLTRTANYIASEFRRFGLKPGGDSGTYLMDYPIARKQLLPARSTIAFGNGDRAINATFERGAALLGGPTDASGSGPVVLIGGRLAPDSLRGEAVKGKMVVYVPGAADQRLNRAGIRLLQRLGSAGAAGIVMVISSDSVFAGYARSQALPRTVVGASRGIPIVAILERGILEQVPEAGDQFAELRAAAAMAVVPMPDWTGTIALRDTTLAETRAPNTVGILEGSDPVLRHEYVVFSAHMDHVGTAGQPGASCRPRGADSICNGADDDGSGTVGVIELAEAFSQPGARPRRSVIFLTVSGEEHGLWGSAHFAAHPPVPIDRIVADLNADMIGRNWKDTIVVIGKEHSDLGATLAKVNAAHPELRMAAIDDRWPEERFYSRSDHFNFAVKGVPILFFFNGVHDDYHQATDSPDKIDAEKESRVIRLMFYLGQEVANAPNRPRWNPESYRQIVTPNPD